MIETNQRDGLQHDISEMGALFAVEYGLEVYEELVKAKKELKK